MVFLASKSCWHACREKKRGYLQSLKDRVESLQLDQTKLKQAVLQRDNQLMHMRGLPALHPQGLPFTTDTLLSASSQSLGCVP